MGGLVLPVESFTAWLLCETGQREGAAAWLDTRYPSLAPDAAVSAEPALLDSARVLAMTGREKRCRQAWDRRRPVMLDYPNRFGLRRYAQVVAARYEEVEQGPLLYLWVRSPEPDETD